MLTEKELTKPVDLCLPNGRLNPQAVGWSKQPLQNCRLYGHPLRKKRWNYWCVTSPTHLFSVTLSNVDYAGLPFIYFLDFATGEFIEKTIITPFGKDVVLGDCVGDDAVYAGKGCEISMRQEEGGVRIWVEVADFGGKVLKAEFQISEPENHESLNVVVPWSERLFQFTAKNNTLPTQGSLFLDGTQIIYEAGKGFATLDFGRGVGLIRGFGIGRAFLPGFRTDARSGPTLARDGRTTPEPRKTLSVLMGGWSSSVKTFSLHIQPRILMPRGNYKLPRRNGWT